MRVVTVATEVSYITAHWVAPQQSLMMAAPDLVMKGLLGGGSGICRLGFGGSVLKKQEHGDKKSKCRLISPSVRMDF